MLGQIRAPLVSGDPHARYRGARRYWLIPLVAGLVTGSVIVAVVMTTAGMAVGAGDLPGGIRRSLLAGFVVLFLGFDLHAFSRGTVSRLGLRRQTPQRLKYTSRRSLLAFAWGTDIGSGVSTFRVTSAIWAVSLALLLGLAPVYAGALYGVGLALVLGALIASGIVGPAVASRLDKFMVARRLLQGVHIAALVGLGVALLTQ